MPATTGDIYISGEYASRHPAYHVEDSAWKAGHILDMIGRHNLRPRTVCEVGCGAGEVLRQVQQGLPAEVECHGYEISPQAFALCLERGGKDLHFHREDFLSQATDRFDLLLCIDVFEHVEDYIGFLRGLRGRADWKLFHIPLDLSVQSVLRVRPMLETRRNFGHLHYFSKDTALATLRDAGYQIVDWRYTASGIDRAAGVRQQLAKLPRKLLAMLSRDFAVRLLGGHSLLVLAR